MDFVKFAHDRNRMCNVTRGTGEGCKGCPLDEIMEKKSACSVWCFDNPEKAIEAVGKWAAEHPVKTRQGEFLKHYPDVVLDGNGIINISPCRVDPKQHPFNGKDCCEFHACSECRREFWGQEVE